MTEKAVKALRGMPKQEAKRFLQKIDLVAQDPYAPLPFVKRLKNSQNFRFRVGDYRGVYNVLDDVLTITVIAVAHLREIYRRWGV